MPNGSEDLGVERQTTGGFECPAGRPDQSVGARPGVRPSACSARTEWRRYLGYLLFALVVVAADQASKVAVLQGVGPGRYVPIAGATFGIRLVQNTGMAFSLFQSAGPVLIGVTLVAVGAILYYSRRAAGVHPWMLLALSLQLGGALGNLVDRVRFGHVIDFLYLSFWPTFNVADIAITLGAGLLGYCLLVSPDPARTESS